MVDLDVVIQWLRDGWPDFEHPVPKNVLALVAELREARSQLELKGKELRYFSYSVAKYEAERQINEGRFEESKAVRSAAEALVATVEQCSSEWVPPDEAETLETDIKALRAALAGQKGEQSIPKTP
jgi:hypothetical protein